MGSSLGWRLMARKAKGTLDNWKNRILLETKQPPGTYIILRAIFPPCHHHCNRSRIFIGFPFRLVADILNSYAVTYHLAMPDIIEMKSDGIPVINHVIAIVFPFFSAFLFFIFLYAHAHPVLFYQSRQSSRLAALHIPFFSRAPRSVCH